MNNKLEKKYLVIGYGNTLRCDDGIGQIIAEEIESFKVDGLQCIYQHQLTPELVEKIYQFSTVIFIDASINHQEVMVINLPRMDVNYSQQQGHFCHPEYLLYLTDLLYQKKPSSFLITIPIINLDLGEELSPLALQSKQKALTIIKEMIK